MAKFLDRTGLGVLIKQIMNWVQDKLDEKQFIMKSGTGISIDADGITINHSNKVTAAEKVGGSTNETPGYGATFTVPHFTYDAQGHITGSGTKTVKIPASDNTDTKVTSVDNHYTPTGTETKSASGGASTDITGSATQVVTGVTVDAAGHVTAVTSKGLKSTNTGTTDSALTKDDIDTRWKNATGNNPPSVTWPSA